MTDINELKQYVDTQDTDLAEFLHHDFEEFTHEVMHILSNYEDYLTGRIGSIHNEVWEGVDSALSSVSTAPVQNKVIYEALNNKADTGHTHDSRYYVKSEINNFLTQKVNKEDNKGLSTNDFTNEYKTRLDTIYNNYITVGNSQVLSIKGSAEIIGRTGNVIISPADLGLDATRDIDKPISTATQTALNLKVDKEQGKGLSTNDFTNAYKSKLDNLDLSDLSVILDDALSLTSDNAVKNRIIKGELDLKAPINSPTFTGVPQAPTAALGTHTNQIATTAFVAAAITGGALVIDDALSLQSTNPVQNKVIATALEAKASLASPEFTGIPLAPTATSNTSNNQIATTAFVHSVINNQSSDTFLVTYGVTAAADIYTAFTNNKYILCKYQDRTYSIVNCTLDGTTYIIDFACIVNSINYSISLIQQGTNDPIWSNNSAIYTLKATPLFDIYPQYDNFTSNTPEPTLPNQFVTKRYVDGLITNISASYITIGQDSTKLALLGNRATAEGYLNNAQGDYSHTEGYITTASGYASHAEGLGTTISSPYGHAGGCYNLDITEIITDPNTGDVTFGNTYLELIGNGSSSTPSNARTLDFNGNEVLAGKLTVGAGPTNNMDVATKQYVDTSITSLGSVLNYKGIKTIATALPVSDNLTGDVWSVSEDNSEYVWTGSAWEKLGPVIDLSGYAPLDSPAFTGTPTAPTPDSNIIDNTRIATTAFVHDLTDMAKVGQYSFGHGSNAFPPGSMSDPTSSTAEDLYNNTYLAIHSNQQVAYSQIYIEGLYRYYRGASNSSQTGTTVQSFIVPLVYIEPSYTDPVTSRIYSESYKFSVTQNKIIYTITLSCYKTSSNGAFTYSSSSTIAALATSNSPALTGTPTAPTAAAGTNTTQIATTAYVQTELSNFSTCPYSRGTTAPTNTQLLWIDTTGGYNILKFYDGSNWTPITSVWTS